MKTQTQLAFLEAEIAGRHLSPICLHHRKNMAWVWQCGPRWPGFRKPMKFLSKTCAIPSFPSLACPAHPCYHPLTPALNRDGKAFKHMLSPPSYWLTDIANQSQCSSHWAWTQPLPVCQCWNTNRNSCAIFVLEFKSLSCWNDLLPSAGRSASKVCRGCRCLPYGLSAPHSFKSEPH